MPPKSKTPPNDPPRRAGSLISTGFALMSLVPILLALYLVSQPGPDGASSIGPRQGTVLGLMLAAAVSGFLFIKSELSRILADVLARAGREASGDMRSELRQISEGEMARISGTIEQLASRFDDGNEHAGHVRTRLREGLTHLAAALQRSEDTQRLIEVFTSSVREAADACTAYFVTVDEEAGDFVTSAADGAAADEVRSRRVPLGEGVPGLAARERGPILLHDLDSAGRAGSGLRSAPVSTIAAPMHIGESLFGVLILHDRKEGGRFDDGDVAVVASLTTIACSVLAQQRIADTLDASLDQFIRSFALAIESRDPYSRGHCERVALYCTEMGRALKLDEDTIATMRRAAYLHGVGRISLPDTLLRKEERYSEDDLKHIRTYPARSEEIVRDVPALAAIAPMVRDHLEAVDGSGPNGVGGDDIPLTTHILIVANAFDAMTSDRSYRQARSLSEAFRQLKEGAGKLYDRRAVRALMELDPRILKGSSGPREPAGAVRGQGNASISVME